MWQGNGITKRMLTDAIYKPCLPHRARKSVWQYVHRIYPPYLWVSDRLAGRQADQPSLL